MLTDRWIHWCWLQDLLILTLGLCYAVIAPMILPFTALYFVFALMVYKNQVNLLA